VPIDFTLNDNQRRLRREARQFATGAFGCPDHHRADCRRSAHRLNRLYAGLAAQRHGGEDGRHREGAAEFRHRQHPYSLSGRPHADAQQHDLWAGGGCGGGVIPGVGTGVCIKLGNPAMYPQATSKATSGTVEGGVPTRALQLTDDYMYDGWGRRFRYAADPIYTATGSLPTLATCYTTVSPDTSAITVEDSTGAVRSNNAAYALISYGSNGHGAYTGNGTMYNAGNSNANKLTNCNCTSAGVANGTYVPTYVAMMPTVDSTGSNNNFDDIVTYKDAWQLQAPNFPLTSANCSEYMYVSDHTNNRVQVFNTSGTFVMGIGAGYQGASGSIGSTGTGKGQFNVAAGIAIDSSGNIWVSDRGNNRLQKFNSSGTFQLGIGSG
jgi:hypothetical protein